MFAYQLAYSFLFLFLSRAYSLFMRQQNAIEKKSSFFNYKLVADNFKIMIYKSLPYMVEKFQNVIKKLTIGNLIYLLLIEWDCAQACKKAQRIKVNKQVYRRDQTEICLA